MKKYLLTLFSVLVSVTLMGQSVFTNSDLVFTQIGNTTTAKVKRAQNADKNILNIPETCTIGNNQYTVVEIESEGFYQLNNLKELTIPNTVTVIGENAFKDCTKLEEVNMGDNVTEIGDYAFYNCQKINNITLPNTLTSIGAYAFSQCGNLNSISIPEGITVIKEYTFQHCKNLNSITLPNSLLSIEEGAFLDCNNPDAFTTITFPSNLTNIGKSAFQGCTKIRFVYTSSDITIKENAFSGCENITAYVLGDVTFTTSGQTFGGNLNGIIVPCGMESYYAEKLNVGTNKINQSGCIHISKQDGPFHAANTWNSGNTANYPSSNDYFVIKEEHTVTLNQPLQVQPYKALNKGVLRIVGDGQLIDNGTGNTPSIGGEIEVVTPATQGRWNFVGAPFSGYNLYAMKLSPNGEDATVVEFDYDENDWSMYYSYADDVIGKGEGFFAWPFYSGGITFSTKEDHSTPSYQNTAKASASDFTLNNGDVTVAKTILENANASTGRWMALVNPYPAKLSVNSFVGYNSDVIYDDQDQSTQIQGQGVYVLNTTVVNNYQTWEYKSSGDLNVGQGFFVNLASGEAITFKKSQLSVNQTKSKAESEKEFIRFAMIEGERESEVLFAHNQDAQEGYDIFDANKLFAMSHIAEPYFVVGGISLVKEEVNLLPYYATMNVKSFGNKEVKFRPNYIPEGLSVTLIDGEESIDLLQGQEYATEISAGENANRFKLLIKKSLGLSDAEELEVNISNDNRIVNIATSETDLQIEVYNALGQKVFETKALNFSLNNVSAGAYMIKAFNNKASKTQKIVVK